MRRSGEEGDRRECKSLAADRGRGLQDASASNAGCLSRLKRGQGRVASLAPPVGEMARNRNTKEADFRRLREALTNQLRPEIVGVEPGI